jgi:hypothetical protein
VEGVPLAGEEPEASAVGLMTWREGGAQAGMGQRAEGKPCVHLGVGAFREHFLAQAGRGWVRAHAAQDGRAMWASVGRMQAWSKGCARAASGQSEKMWIASPFFHQYFDL